MLGYIQDRLICSKAVELENILGPTYVFHKQPVVCRHGTPGISEFGNKSISLHSNSSSYEVMKFTNVITGSCAIQGGTLSK